MSIGYIVNKIKSFASSTEARDLYVVLLIILVGVGSFGLGRLSKISQNKEPIKITYDANLAGAAGEQTPQQAGIRSDKKEPLAAEISGSHSFVASKRGKKYYDIDCEAAKSLKEENKIYFDTEEQAQKAGYSASSSC